MTALHAAPPLHHLVCLISSRKMIKAMRVSKSLVLIGSCIGAIGIGTTRVSAECVPGPYSPNPLGGHVTPKGYDIDFDFMSDIDLNYKTAEKTEILCLFNNSKDQPLIVT